MPERVMVDLETLGTEPGCAILSVGAVRFDREDVRDPFHRSVSVESCEAAGLTVDGETLDWWLEQDADAIAALGDGEDLRDVLYDFSGYARTADEIWANAPTFDCRVLGAAYDAVGLSEPWEYYDERCHRTLKNLDVAPDLDQDGTEHDALDDARHQARVASAALQAIDEAAEGGDDSDGE